jgi:hypothetical protein
VKDGENRGIWVGWRMGRVEEFGLM